MNGGWLWLWRWTLMDFGLHFDCRRSSWRPGRLVRDGVGAPALARSGAALRVETLPGEVARALAGGILGREARRIRARAAACGGDGGQRGTWAQDDLVGGGDSVFGLAFFLNFLLLSFMLCACLERWLVFFFVLFCFVLNYDGPCAPPVFADS
jgi:hypothetical protein